MPALSNSLTDIATRLNEGELAAVPTETVYGLAGIMDSPSAIDKIFELKQRPKTHPLIIHLATTDTITRYTKNVPEYAYQLIEAYWPGPLTLVFDKTEAVPDKVTGGQASVALRMPKHPLLQELLPLLKSPIAAPSANQFGHISPTTAEGVLEEFQAHELAVLDGGRCLEGIESTIIDVRNPKRCYLLRSGSTSSEELAEYLSQFGIEFIADEKPELSVPGNLPSHYAPHKPLHLFSSLKEFQAFSERYQHDVYVIARETDGIKPHYTMPSESKAYAHELYHQLRAADNHPASAILFQRPESTEPAWQAIHEKLTKASANWR